MAGAVSRPACGALWGPWRELSGAAAGQREVRLMPSSGGRSKPSFLSLLFVAQG